MAHKKLLLKKLFVVMGMRIFVGTKMISLFLVLQLWVTMFYYCLGGKLELLCIMGNKKQQQHWPVHRIFLPML